MIHLVSSMCFNLIYKGLTQLPHHKEAICEYLLYVAQQFVDRAIYLQHDVEHAFPLGTSSR